MQSHIQVIIEKLSCTVETVACKSGVSPFGGDTCSDRIASAAAAAAAAAHRTAKLTTTKCTANCFLPRMTLHRQTRFGHSLGEQLAFGRAGSQARLQRSALGVECVIQLPVLSEII